MIKSACAICSYFVPMLLVIGMLGCASKPPHVPLVYEYPIVGKPLIKSAETAIVVDDQRTDKTLDNFIAPNVPDAIKSVISRELPATGCMGNAMPGNSDEGCSPVQIRVQLLSTSVSVPGRETKQAGVVIATVAAALLAPVPGMSIAAAQAGTAAGRPETDVVGEVRMHVHIHNVRSGADWEETWIGANTCRVPIMYMDKPQTNSKALGGAIKDAMSHLPDALAHVGIEP